MALTVVGRVCLNRLRSRRSRREVLTDFHLSDPVVTFADASDPEQEAILGDSVGLALQVVLDALTPAERVAFVLHDVFAIPFAEIAHLLDRSEAAAQQLASRARRRVAGSPEPDRDLVRQREVVDAFFAVPRVTATSTRSSRCWLPTSSSAVDGGVGRSEASVVLRGSSAVAGHTRTYAGLYPHLVPAFVNGAAGVVVAPGGHAFSVMSFAVIRRTISRIDALVDPDRLAALELELPGRVRS